MEQKIHKRLLVIILTAVLMINSLQLPGNIIQAAAQERMIENTEEFSAGNITASRASVTEENPGEEISSEDT